MSAGVKGGLAGSVAMAALAMLYGVISKGASGTRSTSSPPVVRAAACPTVAELAAFRLQGLFASAP